MSAPARRLPRVVLVGAGHGHLVALGAWRDQRPAVDPVLIDPGTFSYSGMATGVVAGDYTAREASLDPGPLVAAAGGRWLPGRVAAVDRGARRVVLESGEELAYDVLSLNVGSAPALPLPSGLVDAYPVKPVASLHALGAALAAGLPAEPLVVVGGGVTAAEVACCAASRLAGRGEVVLVHAGERLAIEPAGAARRVERALADRGVRVECAYRVGRITQGRLLDTGGRPRAWRVLVVAAGLRPAPLVTALGLAAGPAGLRVTRALHAPEDDRLFAVGDCADVGGLGLPPVGVYGVRAGAVLARNLSARAHGRPLDRYDPQSRYLWIMNLGQQDGLASWGRFSLRSRWFWRLKDHIDRRFLTDLRTRSEDRACASGQGKKS